MHFYLHGSDDKQSMLVGFIKGEAHSLMQVEFRSLVTSYKLKGIRKYEKRNERKSSFRKDCKELAPFPVIHIQRSG